MTRSPFFKPKFWFSALLGLGFVILLAIVCQHFMLQTLLQMVLVWIKNLGPTGVLAFIVIYNLATLLFIPGSLLTLGGGVIYGLVWGSVYVVIAATLGATVAFWLGRSFARAWVKQAIQGHPHFQAIDQAVAREGFKIVLLTRLSPMFPFNLLNYLFGVTCVSLKDYVFGSIGIIPGTVMYVYLGSLVGDLALLNRPAEMNVQAQVIQWGLRIVGFLATVMVTIYLIRMAKQALNQSIAAGESQQ